ncbi:MAG TPA: GTPase, partial [Acidimicrobiia bacterium]
MKSGFVPVVGRPNVGKSTLVNKLVGSKVSITSSRPQTTRNVIRGVVNGPDPDDPTYQIVFLDTPGLHKPKTDLGDRLNALVYGTLGEADVVMFMIDA